MIEENIRRKIQELIDLSGRLIITSSGVARDTQHLSECHRWITEALNVIQLAIPMPNSPYRRRIEKLGEGSGQPQRVASIAEILRALLPDIDAGLLGDLGNK